MAQIIADRRDIDFVLYEQIKADELTRHERFAGLDRKTFDLIIQEARTFAVKEILPTFAEGDRRGVTFSKRRSEGAGLLSSSLQAFLRRGVDRHDGRSGTGRAGTAHQYCPRRPGNTWWVPITPLPSMG